MILIEMQEYRDSLRYTTMSFEFSFVKEAFQGGLHSTLTCIQHFIL